MHWLQDPNHSNVDNLYNQKKEYLKVKLMNLKLTVR